MIDHASENMKNLPRLNHLFTKPAAPVFLITNRAGARCYDGSSRSEAIAEYLERQCSRNPPANSPTMQEHYAREGRKVSTFMATPPPTLPGDLLYRYALLKRLNPFLPLRQEQYQTRISCKWSRPLDHSAIYTAPLLVCCTTWH
ncbi:hypothetical protein EVAR_6756_1 [Eumeta japonica]|uniref:Uncharacterized protein n=1 Tax=Eumeta variegata TaxID=151549 RepID=A0A4C1V3M8_EUMVA|nr:hypothetical protein EVAR_6756_1 [Eumeta japonica]